MRAIVASFLLAALFESNITAAANIPRKKRVEKSSNKIGQLFVKTKTICVGRYLFEVPANSTVVYGPASTPYHIKRYPGKAREFDQMVDMFASEAISKKSKFPIGPASSPGSMAGTIVPGYGDNNKIVYGVEASTGGFYQLQSLVAVGSDVYVQEHSYFGDPLEMGKVIEELRLVAANIVPRTTDGAPSRPGVCIDGALVLGQDLPHHERTTVGVRLREFNDVHFTMEMTLKDRVIESDALEVQLHSGEQSAKAEGRGEWYSRIKFIRRAERQISGWNGYEALIRRPPQGRYNSTHEFSFVSQGEPNNPMLPMIDLELYTGIQDNTVGIGIPSLSDSETVELWERLTQSIRPFNSTSK